MKRLSALFLLLAAGMAGAAEWPAAAPCNGTLQACINATPAGGVVVLRSSASIDEEIVLNKSFSLLAAPGYRPLLANSRSIAASAPPGAGFALEISGVDLTRGRVSVLAGSATNVSVRLERVNIADGRFAAAVEIVGGSAALNVDVRNCRLRLPPNPAEPGHSGILVAAGGSSATLNLLHNRVDIDGSISGAGIRVLGGGSVTFNALGNDVRGSAFMAGINAVQGSGVLNANFVANVVRGQAGGGAAPGALSLRLDGSATARAVLRHNTLVRNEVGIAVNGGSVAPSTIDRNLIAANAAGILIAPALQAGFSVDYNLLHANPDNAYIPGSGNIDAAPRLRSRDELRPAADSPALGVAPANSSINPFVTLPELDADGLVLGRVNADLGAYQRHGSHSVQRAAGGTLNAPLAGPGIPATAFRPFLVSQNWNPAGIGGVYNNRPIGLAFGTQWGVFNQDFSNLPARAAFNVFVPTRNNLPYQDTSASTSSASSSLGSLPNGLADESDRFWLFTFNRSVTPTLGVVNPHPVALLFFSRWKLHNTDGADFPQNASYSLYWQDFSPNAYVHYVSPANRSGHITVLDHPLLNGNSCALPQFSAASAGGVFNPHELGVYYNGARWALFNQDGAALASDMAMNVLVDPAQAEFCDRLFADGYDLS